MGINVEDGGWTAKLQGSFGGEGLPGPWPSGRHCGHLWAIQPQVISSSDDIAMCNKKWQLWSLDIENALLQADGFFRDVLLQAPIEWEPIYGDRAWKLKTPVYGLNDAPEEFHRSLEGHLSDSEASMKRVGLRCQVSTFDPCLLLIEAPRARRVRLPLTLMIFLGAANQMFCPRFGMFLGQRSGDLKLQGSSLVRVGMEVARGSDFPAPLT